MPGTFDFHGGNGVVIADSRGLALLAAGPTVPTDGSTGYSPGCIFLHTDGGDGVSAYLNEATDVASCDFNAFTIA